MSHSSVQEAGFADYRAATHRHLLLSWIRTIRFWAARQRQRRALAELEDQILDDIGISREQAHREAAKPFWKR